MAAPITEQARRQFAGYRMPAEWAPHLATYMVWPHNLETWPGNFEPIPARFAAIVAGLSRFESVRLVLKNNTIAKQARNLLQKMQARFDRIEFLTIETNDSWIRDYGPIFVQQHDAHSQPRQIALNWDFNSWGAKYGPYDQDRASTKQLAAHCGFETVEVPMVLEGGSIDVNGAGSLLTTESCILNPNRNPSSSRDEIEGYLRVFLGVSNILWLGDGIAGDDTDGHVDTLARFVSPDTIVAVVESDRGDQNYQPLAQNLERLRAMRDQDGRALRIETLPMPPPLYYQGQRLPASYANFYIANGAVLVPMFDCAADAQALAILRRLFPSREVTGFPCLDLVWGLGTIHCLTQQHPALV